MSEKRMFSLLIVDSDDYLDLPFSAQSLYFQICMRADDDGLIDNTKKIMRITGCKDNDLKRLVSSGFLLQLDDNVYAVTHWNIHNSIRGDRKKPSIHLTALSQLSVDECGKYVRQTDNQLPDILQPDDNQLPDILQPNDALDIDIDIDKDIDKDKEVAHLTRARSPDSDFENPFVPETLIPNATEYAQKVFDILKLHDLPCCRGNFVTFLQRDFKIALQGIHELKLMPEEVFAALENYCKVIELKRQGLSWWESELTFFNLCSGRGKAILRFLPENFNIDDYKKSRDSPGSLPEDRIRL